MPGKPILITCYSDPDIDGIASALAYSEFLNKKGIPAEAGIFGLAHEEARHTSQTYHAPLPRTLTSASEYEKAILVDASDIAGLEGKFPPEKVVEIIDHRKIHEAEKFPNATKIQIELVGAAATLIAEKFMTASCEISRESAVFLYAAIISNTLNFKSGTTTMRDKDAAAWLKSQLHLPEDFIVSLFRAKSHLEGKLLAARMHHEIALFEFGGKCLGIVQIEAVDVMAITARKNEIFEILSQLKTEFARDLMYLSIIDLENDRTFFFTKDLAMQKTLTAVLDIPFTDNEARLDRLLMRKQTIPLIKSHLEMNPA